MASYGSSPGGLPLSSDDGSLPIVTSKKVALALGVAGVFGVAMISLNNNPALIIEAVPATSSQLDVSNKLKPLDKPLYGDMSAADILELFGKFKDDFERDYADEAEETFRFEQFKKNLKLIDSVNNQNPYAVFTVTRYTDFTDDERAKRRMSSQFSNYEEMKADLPSEISSKAKAALESYETGVALVSDDIVSGPLVSAGEVGWCDGTTCAACNMFPELEQYNMSHMPTNFDWRDLGAVTSVKNQGYCGSCWTFSTAADVEGKHFFASGELQSFSEQQLVACNTANYGCDGGYQTAAFQYLMDIGGMVHDEAYPYKRICAWDACDQDISYATPTCDKDIINEALEDKKVAHVSAWQMVALGAEYEETMALALVKNGPLSISINANAMDYYDHGIVGCAEYDDCEAGDIDHHITCDPTELDHAVLLVGYGTSDGTEDGLPYWMVKNSWGKDWGENGYWRTVKGENHCGIANFAQTSVVKAV